MGPNDGKSLLEITRCLARALMSTSPVRFSVPTNEYFQFFEYESKYGSLNDKWVEFTDLFNREKYYFYKGSDGTAASSAKRPRGVKIAARFNADIDVSQGGLIIVAFRKAVDFLEGARARDIVTQEEISNLKEILDACDLNYGNLKIANFRKALKEVRYQSSGDPMIQSLLVSRHLNSFFQELKEKRRSYCVDGYFFGSILTIIEILIQCTSGLTANDYLNKLSGRRREESVSEDKSLSLPIDFFVGVGQKLLWPLLYGHKAADPTRAPIRILHDTIYLAVKAGFAEKLLKIAYAYREKIETKIEEALNSGTIDESLDFLYEAIPFAVGATVIFLKVSGHAKNLSASEVLRAKRSYSIMEETAARLTSNSFFSQVIDLLANGDYWRGMKIRVQKIKREQGEEAAKRFVSMELVEGHLIYPRVFIPKLLSDNQDVDIQPKTEDP